MKVQSWPYILTIRIDHAAMAMAWLGLDWNPPTENMFHNPSADWNPG